MRQRYDATDKKDPWLVQWLFLSMRGNDVTFGNPKQVVGAAAPHGHAPRIDSDIFGYCKRLERTESNLNSQIQLYIQFRHCYFALTIISSY